MSTKKVVHYNFLYSLPASALEYLKDKDMEKFVFQGSKNWDLYFDSLMDDDASEFKDVNLLEFDNKEEFQKYLDKNVNVIDYSLEHSGESGKFYILTRQEREQ